VTDAGFDLGRGWALDERVALRPEPFGALAYHRGTRRLSFIKTPKLLSVVRALASHPTGGDACLACGVTAAELPSYASALGTLARTGMIAERVTE
jgi:putative mycofactocin binding protein MftB